MNALKKALQAGLLVFLCLLSSACISLEYGTPLITEGLDSLELGQSTHADILLALGRPRGNGSVHLSQHPEPRDILFYEFVKTDSKNVDLEMLLVFMLGNHYDGYLWFASSNTLRSETPYWSTKPEVEGGYFPDTRPLEDNFVRGHTSRNDVLTALGAPTGIGAAMLPPEYQSQDVLYYEEVEAQTDTMREVYGEIVMNMRQRILLVMFTADVYDGYFWYSNVGTADVKVK